MQRTSDELLAGEIRGTSLAADRSMKDVFVILHPQAIPITQQLCANLPDYEVFLFDFMLADLAIDAKLHQVQVFPEIEGPSYVSLDREAHAAAKAFEEALNSVQHALSGVSIVGWQHLTLWYFFLALRWYTALWHSAGARLTGHRVHVPVNQCSGEFAFDSFVPAATLIDYLQRQRIEGSSYAYSTENVPPDRVPDLSGVAKGDGSAWLLVHVPTCFYDNAYFGQELRASEKRIVNLHARRWNVPVEADQTIGLIPTSELLTSLAPATQLRIDSACTAMSASLEPLLAAHFSSPQYRARQAQSILNLYRAQLVTYFGLEKYCHTDPPAKLVLSEHDTGFHGPLVSFAESRSLPVILVPHSKVVGDLEFGYENILVLTHPMQGTSIHDAHGRSVTNHPLAYPESFCSNSGIGDGLRTLSLLLTSQSFNGIHIAAPGPYMDGIKRIVAWCRAHDVHVKIRCKPGFTLFALLHAYVGADPAVLARNADESMDDHVRGCDLCLMYESPTTGSLFFLRRSVPVLMTTLADLATHQRALLRADLIAPESVETTLRRLDAFHADPLALYAFRAAQFSAYVGGFARARPLRCFL